MDFERFKAQLYKFDALNDKRDKDEIQYKALKRVEPQYAEAWPDTVHSFLRMELIRSGRGRPYKHQVEAFNEVQKGHDVVLQAPTASGKTLAFTVPMIDALLRDPDAHALMIHPMNALSFDQLEQLQHLCDPLDISIGNYIGETPGALKKQHRTHYPRVLLTNPEFLNASLLGWRKKHWLPFLRKIKFVVIDEMHLYRGYFGCHMALLLRRFLLQLFCQKSIPRVFLASATCENPKEHAFNLTERKVTLVSAKDAVRPRRHFLFAKLNPSDSNFRKIHQKRVVNAALAILEEGMQALIFGPSKAYLDEACSNCKRRLEEQGSDASVVEVYYADRDSSDKKDIQKRIKSGQLRVVFTSNALEVGIDIGGLDGIVLAGFPPNVMSAWQQIGRAGRNWKQDAFVLFFAMNDPIDNFFVTKIEAFLNKPLDHLVVDPANDQLIERHMESLQQEIGWELEPDYKEILGEAFFKAANENKSRPIRSPGYRPQIAVSRNGKLRGISGENYLVEFKGDILGRIPEIRRFREAYDEAIFPFIGRRFRVMHHIKKTSDTRDANKIVLQEAKSFYRTEGNFNNFLNIREVFDRRDYDNFTVIYGKVGQVLRFNGYRLIDERTEKALDSGGESDFHNREDLHAFWIQIPDGNTDESGYSALQHILRLGAIFPIPADRYDTSTHLEIVQDVNVFFYENYPGGIGLAKKLFDIWTNVLEEGIRLAKECACPSGCPLCIEPAKTWNLGNVSLNKKAGITIARGLIEAAT